MRFSAAYSPAPVCSPTRISLQTGKSPAQSHWTKAAPSVTAADGLKLIPPQSRRHIQAGEITIAELLRSGGYRTAHYGKWHLGGGGPASHGYDESDGDTGNRDAAPHKGANPVDIFGMGGRAAVFMEKSQEAGQPFFIQMSYNALHYPENASPAMAEKYAARLPKSNKREIGRAAISEDLDRGVGELLAKLNALGIEDNTYVIYMSDNGAATRGVLRGGKGDLWEGGIRVPLIIRGPGIAAGSWSHERVVGYDLFPTFCEWAKVEAALPKKIEGGSITHLLGGSGAPVRRPREELVFHFPHYQGDTPHTALMLGNYKLIRFYEDDSRKLFDLSIDLGESNNLATAMPEKVLDLEARMKAYLAAVDAQLPVPNPVQKTGSLISARRGGGGAQRGDRGEARRNEAPMQRAELDPSLRDIEP
jgi:arylsulfatase A-like enzyme